MSGFGVLEYIGKKKTENSGIFWIITYLLIFIIPIGFSVGLHFLLEILNFPTDLDDDTVRYLLSAFIQSLAAIIAIVVSLTLVAIQFTASEYSIRVIEIFKKNPAMWAIILEYISGISLFAFILLSIYHLEKISGIKSYCVFYSFFLFIALLIMLIPYIKETLNNFNAEEVIRKLINMIDVDNLTSEKDPFQPAFDVIYGAIQKDDYSTMSHGLKCATDKFLSILPIIEKIPDDSEKIKCPRIYLAFFSDIKRCAFKLIDKGEEIFVNEITIRIEDILFIKSGNQGNLELRKDSCSLYYIIDVLTKIFEKAIKKEMNYEISTIFLFLKDIESKSRKNPIPYFERYNISKSYGKIAKAAIENKNLDIAMDCVNCLSKIIDSNMETDEEITNSAVESLENIAEMSLESFNLKLKDNSVKVMYRAYLKADEKNLDSIKAFTGYELIKLRSKYNKQIPELKSSIMNQINIQERDHKEQEESLNKELLKYKQDPKNKKSE